MKDPSTAPNVTGLSPKEGVPGTQIIIRGENLGLKQSDIIGLTICGTDCLMSARWESSKKIIARVGQARGGVGQVIVFTKSGGKGTSSVTFRVFTTQIGILQESAVWVEETGLVGRGTNVAGGLGTSSLLTEDPLGISDGAGSDESQARMANLDSLYPNSSGNIKLENFVPAWYLLVNHQSASMEDLKLGLREMENRMVQDEGGPRQLIKANLHSFLSCVDALSSLSQEIDKNKAEGWPPTEVLHQKLTDSASKADSVFSKILGRKEGADATRNALSLLMRYKFLFFLPSTITKNIEKGEYGTIMSDYARAKKLYADTNVTLFQQAMTEVDNQMNEFRKTLNRKLLQMPTSIDEQRKIVRYLSELENCGGEAEGSQAKKGGAAGKHSSGSPGWDCLSGHEHWIQGILWDAQNKIHAQQTSAAQSISPVPKWYTFVETVVAELSKGLPELWKLAVAYMEGSLGPKHVNHTDAHVKEMLVRTVTLSTWLMFNASLPASLPEYVRKHYNNRLLTWNTDHPKQTAYLMQALTLLREFIKSLKAEEMSNKIWEPLEELCVTLRQACFQRIHQQALRDIHQLHRKETWKLEMKEDVKMCKTPLADLFLSRVEEAALLIGQVLSDNVYVNHREEINTKTIQLLTAYKQVTETLLKLNSSKIPSSERPSSLPMEEGKPEKKREAVKDKRYVIGLSNGEYVLKHGMPPIIDRLVSAGVTDRELITAKVKEEYSELNRRILDTYINSKASAFNQFLPSDTYDKDKSVVSGVTKGVSDVILALVSVQAELFLNAPQLTPVVLESLSNSALSHLLRLIPPSNLSNTLSSQVLLDIRALEHACRNCASPNKALVARRNSIELSLDFDSKELVNRLLGETTKRMTLALLSLEGNAEMASV